MSRWTCPSEECKFSNHECWACRYESGDTVVECYECGRSFHFSLHDGVFTYLGRPWTPDESV